LNFDKNTAANKVLPQWGVKCFYETFVLKQTVVHLLNFGAENPPLRQYPNRWATCRKPTAHLGTFGFAHTQSHPKKPKEPEFLPPRMRHFK
jgi:hypothetical protein